jgi:ATP-dependent helicase/nuclease subunit A
MPNLLQFPARLNPTQTSEPGAPHLDPTPNAGVSLLGPTPNAGAPHLDSEMWEPQNPTPISDAPARAAALNTHASCIVEAPAGSGKTGLLTQRFLKLLADPGTAQPEEVLAMTFTRKATAEMKERVFHQLQAAARNTPLPDPDSPFDIETRTLALAALQRSDALHWDLLAHPQRLNIRSILSVCMDLANSLPLLSGTGGQQQPIEDARPLYAIAARRTLMQLGGTNLALDQALRTVLLHRDGSLKDTGRLLADMLAAREQWAELVPLTPSQLDDEALDAEVRPRLERALESVVCAGLTRALRALPPGVLHDLTHFAQRLAHQPGYKDDPSPLALCADKHLPPEAVASHLEHWTALVHLLFTKSGDWRKGFAVNHLGFALTKSDKAVLQQLIEEIQTDELQQTLCAVRDLPPARYPDEQWRVARSLFHVLRHALAELKLLFAERNQCDFNELALGAREALSNDTETPSNDIEYAPSGCATDLALSAGGRLRHLLVDEMQDTSSSQYDLIRALTQTWDGHSQTLFLVGDPKQSIYLFRQARVERFLRTLHQARLGDIPLQPLRLTANFRSQSNLVADFNTTFGGTQTTNGIFPSAEEATADPTAPDVPFVAAQPTRPKTSQSGIVWHATVFSKDPEAAPFDHPSQEARAIRSLIEQRLAQPLPAGRTKPWTIAVLGRTRDHLAQIVQEFKPHGSRPEIPFRAVDLDPLGELSEVLDALALTRALLHPADRIAWLAVLHAPWCGLSLADLLTLTGEGASKDPEIDPHTTVFKLVDTRAALLTPQGQQRLARAWPILQTAADTTGRTPLSVHIDRTWRSLGGDAPLTPEQRINVRRYLAILRDLEADTDRIDLSAVSGRLKSLYAEPRANAPGLPINVELMTIHKAKGLEWDVVLIPGLHRKPRASTSVLLNWLELDGHSPDDEASILLAPIYGKGAESDSLNKWLATVRNRRERAEEKRLFYVAVTRAREELHLFAALPTRSGILAQPATGSLLKASWAAAETHFAAALQDSTNTLLDTIIESIGEPSIRERYSMQEFCVEENDFALAAAAEPTTTAPPHYPILRRLPLTFDPIARFTAAPRLTYPDATALRTAATFDRPEGRFAVRAFGNVVHRYLQFLATRLLTINSDLLQADIATWTPRLEASLRGEGLPPAIATREATRALAALQNTLADPIGRWLLSPHPQAASESALNLPTNGNPSLRIDRTFLAGASPLSTGQSHIWIVDFKTSAFNDRADTAFEAAERSKYTAQLEAYATLRRTLPNTTAPIRLGLYYPLIPRLLEWHSEA